MKSSILNLSHDNPLAKGKTRWVFQHPENQDQLIKIYCHSAPPKSIRTIKDYWQSLDNRFVYMSGFMRELREFIGSRYGDQSEVVQYISPLLGLVDTDMGLGLVVQAERDQRGELAPTLRQLKKANALTPERKKLLNNLLQAVLDTELVIGDLNGGNLVLSHHDTLGERFMIIDGMGDRTFLPVQLWSRWINRRNKARTVKKLRSYANI